MGIFAPYGNVTLAKAPRTVFRNSASPRNEKSVLSTVKKGSDAVGYNCEFFPLKSSSFTAAAACATHRAHSLGTSLGTDVEVKGLARRQPPAEVAGRREVGLRPDARRFRDA